MIPKNLSHHALPHGNNGELAILVRVDHDRLELAVERRERDALVMPRAIPAGCRASRTAPG